MSSGFGRSINTQTRSPVPEPKDLVSKRVRRRGQKYGGMRQNYIIEIISKRFSVNEKFDYLIR